MSEEYNKLDEGGKVLYNLLCDKLESLLNPKSCFYIPDGTTSMNCITCGRSKWLHNNNNINNLT